MGSGVEEKEVFSFSQQEVLGVSESVRARGPLAITGDSRAGGRGKEGKKNKPKILTAAHLAAFRTRCL